MLSPCWGHESGQHGLTAWLGLAHMHDLRTIKAVHGNDVHALQFVIRKMLVPWPFQEPEN